MTSDCNIAATHLIYSNAILSVVKKDHLSAKVINYSISEYEIKLKRFYGGIYQ